jgi:riboflavin-specific deaminase-like protein
LNGELNAERAAADAAAEDRAWAAIWQQAIAIAAWRRGAGDRPADAALRWAGADGWQLAEPGSDAARPLFELYKPLLDRRPGDPPWSVAQLGQSLDGYVATQSGDSDFVTGGDNLTHLHRLRALSDAVVVGAGTIAADDPQLTTRRVAGPHPMRVVIDPSLRLAPDARVFRDAAAPTLWLGDAARAAASPTHATTAERVEVPGLLDASGQLDGAVLIAALAARGLRLLFIEGGGVTVSRLLQQGALDRLHLAIAPVLIGAGRPGLRLPGVQRMSDCLRPPARVVPMGDDLLWDLDLSGCRRR